MARGRDAEAGRQEGRALSPEISEKGDMSKPAKSEVSITYDAKSTSFLFHFFTIAIV